ncbi:MAG: ROK family protein [Rubricoccaceae bacterium]
MTTATESGRFVVGIDLGGTNLKAGLVEHKRGVIARTSLPSNASAGPDAVLDQMAEGVADVLTALPPDTPLLGIGIGAPGLVSLDRQTVSKPPNFPGWDVVNLREQLSARLSDSPLEGPIFVENDANVAGLGSAFYGAGVPFDSFIMVTLGTGVGGAIIVNKRLFRGVTGAAGEIGHVSIDYEGPYSRAGVPGAIEAYLGQRYLSHHARYQLLARETNLHETAGQELKNMDPRQLHTAASIGDKAAIDVLAWAGHKLGVMLGSVVNLLDIRKIVVGGGTSQAAEFLLTPARKALLRHTMPAMMEGVELVQEMKGNEVALLGAARLVFEHEEDA